MDSDRLVWLVASALATLTLVRLMRRRQSELMTTLRQFVETQLEWSKKRAKAARMAQRLAQQKQHEEESAKHHALAGDGPGDLVEPTLAAAAEPASKYREVA